MAKRIMDIVLASIMLVAALPVMLLLAMAIKLDSPGPIIFRQTRVGRGGRRFTFYKFRSMYHNSDPQVHQQFVRNLINGNHSGKIYKLAEDKRITRVGRFLRRTSLDELPQLWNVLKGDMSLVGPRPPIPYEVAEYKEWHKQRLTVTPGLTGLWQVTARSSVSFDEMVALDLEYVRRQSLALDIKILLLTIPAVLSGRGAA
jgi:exopolysaccharide biosynthesis polyprenyl glycosylphosphotransferase